MVARHVPEAHHRLLVHIRKQHERTQRHAEDGRDHRAASGATRGPTRRSDADGDAHGDADAASETDAMAVPKRRRVARPTPRLRAERADGHVLDLLDPLAADSVVSGHRRLARQRRGDVGRHGDDAGSDSDPFEEAEDGRLVLRQSLVEEAPPRAKHPSGSHAADRARPGNDRDSDDEAVGYMGAKVRSDGVSRKRRRAAPEEDEEREQEQAEHDAATAAATAKRPFTRRAGPAARRRAGREADRSDIARGTVYRSTVRAEPCSEPRVSATPLCA